MMVGRTGEKAILQQLLQSKEAELLCILGRRRVGKTYLIREVYKNNLAFEFTGVQNGSRSEQLQSFLFYLGKTFGKNKLPARLKSWMHAFEILITLLEKQKSRKKRVIFIDELPWIASNKSDFLKAFGSFWNSWASKQNLIVTICGSAASWMIKKVINNRGGLHNRVTRQIVLQPFNCMEAWAYLKQRGIKLNPEQLTDLYMTFGGIPYYLKQLERGKSVAQMIDAACFAANAPLKNEFDNLYAALFSSHQSYIAVIKACYSKWKGMTHLEIARNSGIASGGTLTEILTNLEMTGFISSTAPFVNNKKETIYRLTDEFSLFYLKYMTQEKNNNFQLISQSQSFKLWQGYAFENFCFRHIDIIKKKLGIAAVITRQYAFNIKNNNGNAHTQIDLIIDRNDQCVNLCEVKYHQQPFTVTPRYARLLEERVLSFKTDTHTRKTIFTTFITKKGLKHNTGLIDSEITLQDFFE
jgi:uncharacterized protein